MAKDIKTIADLIPDVANANKGTERGRYALETSLRKYGAGRSILLDKSGRIVAGNKTAEVAGEIGIDDVIVVQTDGKKLVAVQRTDLDLDSPEGRELAWADNRVGELSLAWDASQLFADIQAGIDLSGMFYEDELAAILATVEELEEPRQDPGPQISRADELQEKWQVQLGDLWQLGEHRLICGDCTDAAVVERVMGGEKAEALITDPPYGIGVDKSMHEKGGQQYGNAAAPKRHYADTDWDDATPAKETVDYLVSLADEVVMWGGNYFELPPTRCYLVWDKQNDGNQFADCELAWTNLDKPVRLIRHMWNGMIRAGKEERYSHPTQKPSPVIVWAIEQCEKDPQVILDTYLGTGTTLIACEQLGRKCRAVEIHPPYCAVTLQRYFDMTGVEPVRIG